MCMWDPLSIPLDAGVWTRSLRIPDRYDMTSHDLPWPHRGQAWPLRLDVPLWIPAAGWLGRSWGRKLNWASLCGQPHLLTSFQSRIRNKVSSELLRLISIHIHIWTTGLPVPYNWWRVLLSLEAEATDLTPECKSTMRRALWRDFLTLQRADGSTRVGTTSTMATLSV